MKDELNPLSRERARLARELSKFLQEKAHENTGAVSGVLDAVWAVGIILMLLSASNDKSFELIRGLFRARWAEMSPDVKEEVKRLLVFDQLPPKAPMAKAHRSVRARKKVA